MSLAFTGGMIGWGSSASTSIIPSEIIGDYTQSLSTATASSEATSTGNEFQLGADSLYYSSAYMGLSTGIGSGGRKFFASTISDTSDLVGMTVTGVKVRILRRNQPNGTMECGFSTRSAFSGTGTIQSSFGFKNCSTFYASGWRQETWTHSGSGYTIPNECTMLIFKTTNNHSEGSSRFGFTSDTDYYGSEFDSGGKGGASGDAIPNNASLSGYTPSCTSTKGKEIYGLIFVYDKTEGGSYSIDSSTTNKWKSNSEATPTLTVDMGSAIDLADLAIFPHSDTTVTTLGIEISTDNSTFTEMKEVETSDLTNGQWNFIGLSTGISARYVRIKSKDSSNAVLAINEVKVRNIPPTPSYNSVTTTFSSASFANSSFASYDSTNNEIDFQAFVNASETNGAFAIDMLGENVSDTAWVMRMKVNFSNIGGGNGSNISFNIAKNGHTTSNATAENLLGWAWGEPPTDGGTGSGQNYIGIRHGTDSSGASSSNYPVNTSGWYSSSWNDSAENTDYYIELKRTSATNVEFTVWTGSYGGTQKVNISRTDIPSGTDDLRYFKFCNRSNDGQPRGGNTSGALKELKFYNGVTSL